MVGLGFLPAIHVFLLLPPSSRKLLTHVGDFLLGAFGPLIFVWSDLYIILLIHTFNMPYMCTVVKCKRAGDCRPPD